jgi:hypothetical protein
MLRRVAVARTDVSAEHITSIIRLIRIGALGTTLAAIINRSTPLKMEVVCSSETSVLTRATLRNIPEDGLLHSHRHENLKSYIALTGWALERRHNVFPVRYERGFISQKTAFFTVPAVKTSNLT